MLLNPDFQDIYYHRGRCLIALDQFEEAELMLQKALSLSNKRDHILQTLGTLHEKLGNTEKACDYFEQAISDNFKNTKAISCLGKAKGIEAFYEQVKALAQQQLNSPDLPPIDQSQLFFALADEENRRKNYDDAFTFYTNANACMRSLFPFNRIAFKNTIDKTITAFSPKTIERFANRGSLSDKAIFILGMPRSGTTLVEQILSSHPEVFGGGEKADLMKLVGEWEANCPQNTLYPDTMHTAAPLTLASIGKKYTKLTEASLPANTRYATDKMPFNFLYIGLIHLILPNAKIIHCVRDPLDTCLSCFFQDFKSVNFSYNLADTGFYYAQYRKLMDHWLTLLPEKIYEINYENLTNEPERYSREMINHINLPWDERCQEFHKNSRSVHTASLRQVRKPIYKTSRQRWRNYEKHLGPLLHELGVNGDKGAP